MKPIRFTVIVLTSALAVLGLGRAALATPTTCNASPSFTLQQGQVFQISGADAVNETIAAIFDGSQVIGSGPMAGGSFSFAAQVPAGALAGAFHTLTLRTSMATSHACPNIFVTAAAATPTPTPTSAPSSGTTNPAPTPQIIVVPVSGSINGPVLQQQQQQQQQGGGGSQGGRGGQQQQGSGGSRSGGQQQQQQQQDPSGVSLPRTGADILRMTEWGVGLLAFGLVLVLIARRRRRKARGRALTALAELPPIDSVLMAPELPWLPGTAHPSEFLTEADGVPPVYLPEPQVLMLPAPAIEEHTEESDEVLLPSF